MATFRDRVKGLRRVKASELVAHDADWRTHLPAQEAALRGILAEVGFAGAILAREREDGKLVILDGHLRSALAPDDEVPVLVLDVTEEEGRKILATHDPIGAMAGADSEALRDLVAGIEAEAPAVRKLLAGLGARAVEGIEEIEPEIPISPELHERQDYLVIAFENEFDWNAVCDRLGVETVAAPANNPKTTLLKWKRGIGRVMTAQKLIAALGMDRPSAAAPATT